MRNLLQTHSLSWAESVRLALLAEGIEAVILDQQSLGYLGFAGRVRVAIVNDSDLARAQQVARELQPPASQPLPSWWWHKRAILLFVLGFTSLFFTSLLPAIIGPAGLLLLIGGVVFIVRGYQADKGQTGASP